MSNVGKNIEGVKCFFGW